ncbi:MAG: hypothetical protein A3J38_07185 [Gammaproteobacteria bacterium RIFCSPHIGHO2_12_FULL_45_9]|nr:MAG: hypothetical protein A3J38_07185 [Gammaproteobacteria bacterium RIFCSPHIGHO2_12_FULL_45_9]
MRVRFLIAAISVGLALISAQTVYASPADSARVLEDKTMSYAKQYANEPSFDVTAAAHDISNDAIMLGNSYSQHYSARAISSAECLAEVATLGANSAAFAQNAQARLYKKIIVDGNIVMFIASSAGMLTHAVLDKGNYCNIEKSVAGAYWSGYIFRLALGAMNMAFS